MRDRKYNILDPFRVTIKPPLLGVVVNYFFRYCQILGRWLDVRVWVIMREYHRGRISQDGGFQDLTRCHLGRKERTG